MTAKHDTTVTTSTDFAQIEKGNKRRRYRLLRSPTDTLSVTQKLRGLALPCEWHTFTVLYIRSLKRLRMERERHSRTYWYVWHPYSPIKLYWNWIYLLFLFAAYIYMPFQVFYICPNNYDPFILFTDGLAFLHICTRFITGYIDRDQKTIILEPKLIALNYLKTYFITDFIGALPLQLIRPFENCEYPSHTAMFVFKLLRTFSISNIWKNVVGQFHLSYICYACIKILIIAIMFFHWMTYIYFQVPILCCHIYNLENKSLVRWLQRFDIHVHPDVKKVSIYQKYTTNLYLVCGLCIGAGYYSSLDHHLIPDFALSGTMGLIGLIFVTFLFATLLRLTIYWQFASNVFGGKYKELEENMSFMRLPMFLQRKIKLFLNYKFNGHYFNEEAIVNTINEQIKQDINLYCCRALVMNVPMFQDMPVTLLNAIVFNLKRNLIMPGQIIVKFGLVGDSLHLISSGTVAVINEAGREVAHLSDGAFFGENALLDPSILRTATIIALEIAEIYMLNRVDFATCLQPYPHLKRKMEEINFNKRAAYFKHAADLRKLKRRQSLYT